MTFRRGATTRALFEQAFPKAEVVMELGSIAAVKGNVRAGIGVALVGRSAVERDLAEGRLVEVRNRRTPIPRPLSLVHAGAELLAPATAALRELLLSEQGRPRPVEAAKRRPRRKSTRRRPQRSSR